MKGIDELYFDLSPPEEYKPMTRTEKDLALIRIIGFDKWLDRSIQTAKMSIEIFVHNEASDIIHRQDTFYFYELLGILPIKTNYVIGVDPWDDFVILGECKIHSKDLEEVYPKQYNIVKGLLEKALQEVKDKGVDRSYLPKDKIEADPFNFKEEITKFRTKPYTYCNECKGLDLLSTFNTESGKHIDYCEDCKKEVEVTTVVKEHYYRILRDKENDRSNNK